MKNKILKKKDYNLLKDILNIPSPSGFEKDLANFLKNYLIDKKKLLPKKNVEVDFRNNVIVTLPSKKNTNKTIIVDAHLDQLGFLISNIDKYGNINIFSIGGNDLSISKARAVTIRKSNGKYINGVINTKPIHLVEDEVEEIAYRASDLYLDVGIKDRNKILKNISIGDPLVTKPYFRHLLGSYYSGTGFDDKVGVFTLLKLIERIVKKKKKLDYDLKIVFSSQEEVGCRGAKEIAYRYKPDLFIGLDVTFATDQNEVEEKIIGRCNLGKGVVIYKGINMDLESINKLNKISKSNKIETQFLATGNSSGTNAKTVANVLGGIKVLDLGIPLRNMHSSVEIVNSKDLKSALELLYEFLS